MQSAIWRMINFIYKSISQNNYKLFLRNLNLSKIFISTILKYFFFIRKVFYFYSILKQKSFWRKIKFPNNFLAFISQKYLQKNENTIFLQENKTKLKNLPYKKNVVSLDFFLDLVVKTFWKTENYPSAAKR